jgi:thioesterase domain-containing protein
VRRTFASFKQLFHAPAIHRPAGAVETHYQSLDEMPAETFQRTIMHALKDYQPNPLDCRAVLFRARDSHKAHLHAYDPALGWDGLFARGLDVFEMPGDHSTILLRENLPRLASLLQEHLPWLDEKPSSNLETAEFSIASRG